eukprot:6022890-Amphidinium_carterae.1
MQSSSMASHVATSSRGLSWTCFTLIGRAVSSSSALGFASANRVSSLMLGFKAEPWLAALVRAPAARATCAQVFPVLSS